MLFSLLNLLFISLSRYLVISFCISISLYLFISLSLYLYISLSLYLFISLSLYLFISLSLLSISLSLYPSLSFSLSPHHSPLPISVFISFFPYFSPSLPTEVIMIFPLFSLENVHTSVSLCHSSPHEMSTLHWVCFHSLPGISLSASIYLNNQYRLSPIIINSDLDPYASNSLYCGRHRGQVCALFPPENVHTFHLSPHKLQPHLHVLFPLEIMHTSTALNGTIFLTVSCTHWR